MCNILVRSVTALTALISLWFSSHLKYVCISNRSICVRPNKAHGIETEQSGISRRVQKTASDDVGRNGNLRISSRWKRASDVSVCKWEWARSGRQIALSFSLIPSEVLLCFIKSGLCLNRPERTFVDIYRVISSGSSKNALLFKIQGSWVKI